MQPLSIPTYGKPLSHCLSPNILPSYMLVHTNHPSFSTILFTSIRHFYLPTCTTAPSYISIHSATFNTYGWGRTFTYPNLLPSADPLPWANSAAIAHPPLWGMPCSHCPSPTYGVGHSPSRAHNSTMGNCPPNGPTWGCYLHPHFGPMGK
jgi:hypothetical protein